MEGLDGLDAPGLALRSASGPDDAGLVGRVDEAPAGGDLDAVAAGLDPVQEEALRDRVLGRRGLDRDAGVDPDVGGAHALLARVDPEGDVVQAAVGAVRVARVDELVGGDRRAHPGAGLGAVVELDALVEPVAERVDAELAVGADIGGEEVDVVEALDRAAAAGVAAGHVLVRRAQVLGRRRSARTRSRARRRGRRGRGSGRTGRGRGRRRSNPRPDRSASIAATRRSSASGLQARRPSTPMPLVSLTR